MLLVEPFLKKDKTAVIAIAAHVPLWLRRSWPSGSPGETRAAFNDMIVLNDYAVFFNVLFAAAGILTVLMSPRYLEANDRHLGEYYALLLFAIVGMDAHGRVPRPHRLLRGPGAHGHQQLPAGRASSATRLRSNEAALKYFLTGAFASAFTLYGVSLVYGLTGVDQLRSRWASALMACGQLHRAWAWPPRLVVAGLGFKVSVAPFHMWTPGRLRGRAHARSPASSRWARRPPASRASS